MTIFNGYQAKNHFKLSIYLHLLIYGPKTEFLRSCPIIFKQLHLFGKIHKSDLYSVVIQVDQGYLGSKEANNIYHKLKI